jgi:O-antigen/teichoic acid export membrane protein
MGSGLKPQHDHRIQARAGTVTRKSSQARGRIGNTATLVLAQALNVASILPITRIYPPAVFGSFATMFAIAAMVGGVSSLRLDVAATTASSADALVLLKSARRLNVAVGVAVGFLALTWGLLTGGNGGLHFVEYLALGAATVTIGASSTLTYARVRDRRYGLVAGSKLLLATIQATGQLALGLVAPSAGALLVGSALGYGASTLLLLRRAAPSSGPAPSTRDVVSRHRGFVVASAPASLINALTLNLPLLAAATAAGSVPAAHLALALRIGSLPSALLGQALMPILFGEIAHKLRSAPAAALRTYTRALAGLSVGGVTSLTALAIVVDLGAARIFGDEWSGTGTMLVLLLPFMISQFAVSPLTQTLSAAGRNADQLAWDIARLVLVAGTFAPVLTGWYGLETGVVAFSAVMVVSYAAHVLLARRALLAAAIESAGRPSTDGSYRENVNAASGA